MAGSIIMNIFTEGPLRRFASIVFCIWYTFGATLCAGAVSNHMLYAKRVLLDIGIGTKGAYIDIYFSGSVHDNFRGSIISMYQLNIALGEVLGYTVAAILYSLFFGLFLFPEYPR